MAADTTIMIGILAFMSLFILNCNCVESTHNSTGGDNSTGVEAHGKIEGHGAPAEGIEIAGIHYRNVKEPLVFTIVVILAALSKVGFHHVHFLSDRVPESCLLIILGLVFGAIITYSGAASSLPRFFKPHDFFQFLLPPIILEAAYSLHDRTFADNLGSVLLFAVLGTILAFFSLGLSLWGLTVSGAMGSFDFDIGLIQILIFAALIVAVDPVAVLAVFQEIGVNNVLYFLVFGESLLNDGVTVVLYQVMQTYNAMHSEGIDITGAQLALGILKFLVVCVGGLALGVLAGLVTAILTKYTRHVKVAQPILIYTIAYLGFLLAEMFEFSGIISIIACGIVQVHYAFHNISQKSRTTVIYFIKVIATTNEIVIFMFLGLVMIGKKTHYWHTGFVLWTLFLCLLYRFGITFFLTFLVNKFDKYRTRKIGYDEQFMIAYGGLRGAVCFSLVAMLDEKSLPPGMKDMFETSTLVVVFFTVFVQGVTIKPLVKLMRVQLRPNKKDVSLCRDLNEHFTDQLMAGVEELVGFNGKYRLKGKMSRLETKYIRKWVQLEPDKSESQLQEYYNKILLKEHYKTLKQGGVSVDSSHEPIPRIPTNLYLNSEEDVEMGPPSEQVDEEEVKPKVKEIDITGKNGLWNILQKHQTSAHLHHTVDRNLTSESEHDMATLIKQKSNANRVLQKHVLSLKTFSQKPKPFGVKVTKGSAFCNLVLDAYRANAEDGGANAIPGKEEDSGEADKTVKFTSDSTSDLQNIPEVQISQPDDIKEADKGGDNSTAVGQNAASNNQSNAEESKQGEGHENPAFDSGEVSVHL